MRVFLKLRKEHTWQKRYNEDGHLMASTGFPSVGYTPQTSAAAKHLLWELYPTEPDVTLDIAPQTSAASYLGAT